MHHFFILPEQIRNSEVTLTGKDVKHIKKVLRLNIGDEVSLSDGKGNLYWARIKSVKQKSIVATIFKRERSEERFPFVTLFQALPKGSKMDLIIRQATELGVKKIVPLVTERSLMHLDEESAKRRVDRWRRIAEEASKQSRRAYIPDLTERLNWEETIQSLCDYDLVVVPWEEEKGRTLREALSETKKRERVAVVIGPEGGFTQAEVEVFRNIGAKIVSLGKNILRTETAAVAVIAVIFYELSM